MAAEPATERPTTLLTEQAGALAIIAQAVVAQYDGDLDLDILDQRTPGNEWQNEARRSIWRYTYTLLKRAGYSMGQISQACGRHHATILHAIDKDATPEQTEIEAGIPRMLRQMGYSPSLLIDLFAQEIGPAREGKPRRHSIVDLLERAEERRKAWFATRREKRKWRKYALRVGLEKWATRMDDTHACIQCGQPVSRRDAVYYPRRTPCEAEPAPPLIFKWVHRVGCHDQYNRRKASPEEYRARHRGYCADHRKRIGRIAKKEAKKAVDKVCARCGKTKKKTEFLVMTQKKVLKNGEVRFYQVPRWCRACESDDCKRRRIRKARTPAGPTKRCPHCGIEKNRETDFRQYRRHRTTRFGEGSITVTDAYCKTCHPLVRQERKAKKATVTP